MASKFIILMEDHSSSLQKLLYTVLSPSTIDYPSTLLDSASGTSMRLLESVEEEVLKGVTKTENTVW